MKRPDIRVLDPDTYANGDPATFGLPLDQFVYLRDEAPVFGVAFDDPLMVDEVWVISRNADITAIDRDPDTWAANRGYVNIWKFNPIDATNGGKPAMLSLDGVDHQRNRRVVSRGFLPHVVQRFEGLFRSHARQIVD